jgi:uncharacterized protein with beta-barrel porin domain
MTLKRNEGIIRPCLAIGYGHEKMKFFGPNVSKEKSAKLNNLACVLSTGYETFNDKQLKTDFAAHLSACRGRNNIHREDQKFHEFSAKFLSTLLRAECELRKDITSRNGLNVGPWLGLRYDRVHQGAYAETCPAGDSGIAMLSSMSHDLFSTIFGINFEREIAADKIIKKNVLFNGKIGWQRTFLEKHGNAMAKIVGIPFDWHAPIVGRGKRNALLVSGDLHCSITDKWELIGQCNGIIAKDRRSVTANLSACYLF